MLIKYGVRAAAALLLTSTIAATPAAARSGVLTVTGTITDGTDGGNDLISADFVGGVWVHHYLPGTVFGAPGDLTGQTIVFSLAYDTATAPDSAAGVFDGSINGWPYFISPQISVGGNSRDFDHQPPGAGIYAPTASLTLADTNPDTVSGDFGSYSYFGGSFSDIHSSAFSFLANLPSGFLSTDAFLPGVVPGDPHNGFAHSAATGVGSFNLIRQVCFIECSFKQATGNFTLTSLAFAAVPEPEEWALLIAGFGLTGAMARRRRPQSITA